MADAEVMKVYRAVAKVRFVEAESCISDGQVLARLRRPPPDVLRRAARLRQFSSLLLTGPNLDLPYYGPSAATLLGTVAAPGHGWEWSWRIARGCVRLL
eukprot:5339196-Pyramimonas_sp.AAC.1